MIIAAIIAVAIVLPSPTFVQGSAAEVAYYLDRLDSPIYLEREEATSILHRACLQDRRRINTIGDAAIRSDSPEVRWRAWAVVRKIQPCGWCLGSGISPNDMDCGSYRIKKWDSCIYCDGTGSLWRPGRAA